MDKQSITNFFETDFNDIKHDIIICPPFPYLDTVGQLKQKISLGAQDCSRWAKSGAYTGDVSCAMLSDLGCEYIIIGHSERRQHHGEADELLREKLLVVQDAGLIPILCVGENLEIREDGDAEKFVLSQLNIVANLDISKLIVAYEPIWSIGTGLVPSNAQIDDMTSLIAVNYDCPVLYGGSVNASNAPEILAINSVDGLLIGGASLKAINFAEIVRF